MKKLIAVLALSFSSSAFAGYVAPNPVALYICKQTFEIQQLDPNAADKDGKKYDYVACISKAKADAMVELRKGLKTEKKAAVIKAVKEYHVAYIAALEGIHPSKDELVIGYKARQAALEDKMNAAFANFEMEASL